MVSGRSDFLYKDDFNGIVAVTENDEKLKLEINSCIKNTPPKKNQACDKDCSSNDGLKRQVTTRYPSSKKLLSDLVPK